MSAHPPWGVELTDILSLDAEAPHASEHFVVNDSNAVVLSFDKILSYMERALEALGFDDNAIRRFFLQVLIRDILKTILMC